MATKKGNLGAVLPDQEGTQKESPEIPTMIPTMTHFQRSDHVQESKTATQTQPSAPSASNATGNGNHYSTVATSKASSALYTKNLRPTL